ncbi:MAG: hypothetical protein ACLU38_02615 [Dysosmobacter sp.]
MDLLRETVKVSLDSAPETLKCYHNCEICVLRNGKGSREGIEIPERPEPVCGGRRKRSSSRR